MTHTLQHLDAPAGLDELGERAGAWTEYLHNQFQAQLLYVRGQYTPFGTYVADLPVHFVDPVVTAPPARAHLQSVVWSGFPRQFLIEERDDRRNGLVHQVMSAYDRAEDGYDTVTYRTATGGTFERKQRRQYEYLEWFVNTDDQGRPTKITFTCEPADYFSALADGYPAPVFNLEGATQPDPPPDRVGDRDGLLALYHRFVNPEVKIDDLICAEDVVGRDGTIRLRRGDYNPWNDWNTVYGIMHTSQLVNTVFQAIQIVGNASVLRCAPDGRPFQSAKALLCCGAYGGANHHSDPAIGAMVNELARARYHVTNANPIGVYMSHIEDEGWAKPDGTPLPRSFWRVERVAEGVPGRPGSARTVRAVYEIPAGETVTVNGITRPMTLNDIRIGGEPVRRAGQIAEAVRMVLTVAAWPMSSDPPAPVGCQPGSGCYSMNGREFLNITAPSEFPAPAPGPGPGEEDAFPNVTDSQSRRRDELVELHERWPRADLTRRPTEQEDVSWRKLWPNSAETRQS